MSLRAVAFDFDGVILESVEAKARAFARLFAAYPDHLSEIVRLHTENAGVSRFEKFRKIHAEILLRPIDEDEVEELGRRFSELALDEVLASPFVPGAERLLEQLAGSYRLFVVSATPEPEIRDIVTRLGLDERFAGVHGAPRPKAETLAAVAADEALRPSEMLFVGDASADLAAATAVGVPFVARARPGAVDVFPPQAIVALVQDLVELGERWAEISQAVDGLDRRAPARAAGVVP